MPKSETCTLVQHDFHSLGSYFFWCQVWQAGIAHFAWVTVTRSCIGAVSRGYPRPTVVLDSSSDGGTDPVCLCSWRTGRLSEVPPEGPLKSLRLTLLWLSFFFIMFDILKAESRYSQAISSTRLGKWVLRDGEHMKKVKKSDHKIKMRFEAHFCPVM